MSQAIVVDDVSKIFRIATDPVQSLKERLVAVGRRHFTNFTALAPLTFSIDQGETVGILGHNGSGKSTLLKCIAGILRPTTGTIAVRGRLASLLELGAGFHPELSGRENVYINAAFLGISRKEIGSLLDDIIDFAELGQFIDEPVKHYSSGMYVRLGFAVAVNLDPDVLLVDEVLAVGDEAFAKKCIGRVKQFQSEGRTILVVTHSSDIVRQVCNRAIVLDHGQLIADGKPADAITIFREHLHGTLIDDTPHRSARVHLDEVRVLDHGDDQVRLEVEVMAVEPTDGVMLSVEVTDKGNRLVYRVDSSQLGMPVHLDEGSTQFAFDLNVSPLLGGTYPCTIRLIEAETGRLLDWHDLQTGVNVTRSTAGEGVADLGAALLRRTHPVDHPA